MAACQTGQRNDGFFGLLGAWDQLTQARTNPAQFVSPQGLVDGPEPENMA